MPDGWPGRPTHLFVRWACRTVEDLLGRLPEQVSQIAPETGLLCPAYMLCAGLQAAARSTYKVSVRFFVRLQSINDGPTISYSPVVTHMSQTALCFVVDEEEVR